MENPPQYIVIGVLLGANVYFCESGVFKAQAEQEALKMPLDKAIETIRLTQKTKRIHSLRTEKYD